MKNGKQPIAPSLWAKFGDGADDYKPTRDDAKNGYEIKFGGLTKREHFSILLMQSLVSNADRHSQQGDCQTWNYQHLSEIAIQGADFLLAELEKPTIQK